MRSAALALISLGMILTAPPARAADKSSTRPNVISVPKGPGSIEGLGESFEANLNSGSVRETVKIDLPPGTSGLAPSLALTYDSGQGNGPLGIGWSLGLSTIQVQTEKGLPRYDGTDRYLLDGAELVPVGGEVYRLKIEGRFVRAQWKGDHWEVDAPDGRTLRYGVSSNGRVSSADETQVFSWALEDMIDRFRNRIGYFYEKDGGQLYLTEIQYNRRTGAADNRVVLEYEPRPDVVTDCRPRFCVETGRRLRVISAYSRGQLVRRYRLDYQEGNGLSLLSAVTQYGSDGTTALPPVRFWYSAFSPEGARPFEMQSVPGRIPGPAAGNDELVDIDGDGFPDLLHAETGAHWYHLNQGGLRFGEQRELYLAGTCERGACASPSYELRDTGVEVADLDGDGLPDLVARVGTDFRYFPNHGDGRWQPSVGLRFTKSTDSGFAFEDANIRLLDFDGDKLVDAVRTNPDGTISLWRNRGDGGWELLDPAPQPLGNTALHFEDANVRLADMNGDRLLDLVYVLEDPSSSVIHATYWPSLGFGRFGDPVPVGGAIPVKSGPGANQFLADVNGDGLADLVLVDTDHVDVWPLLASGAFGEKIVVQGTPHRDATKTAVRLADMNGNGSTDIVWSTPSEQRLEYLDLAGDLRPNLLVAVENGLGKAVTFRYGSSGAEYQEAREAGQQWATRVPFPVQVLTESIVSDGLGHRHVTGYRYRDGWYAKDTREFRGFEKVVRTELGDASETTAVQIHEFDLGQSAECRKGSLLSLEQRAEAETGALLLRDTYAYAIRPLPADSQPYAWAARTKHETEHWEGTGTPVTTREEWTYDDYGNVTKHWEWGIVDPTADATSGVLASHDERITTSEYANDANTWLLGRATRTAVTDAAGAVLSDTRTYYDGEPFVGLPHGQLGAAGAPTRTESWVSGDRWAQTERVQHDEYGLVTATLDPLGARREIDYDPETHTFPIAERAFYGDRVLTFAAEYDLAQGLITTYRDPAGSETTFQWDALHHLTAIVKPGDSAEKPTLAIEYGYGNPLSHLRAMSRVTSGSSDTVEKWSWYDGLGRELGTVELAEGGRTVTSGQKEFGPLGRVVREYEPQFTDGYQLAAPATKHTAHAYDALGREVRTVLPDGSITERRHAPLAIEYWDAEDLDPASPHANTPRTERLNALGVAQVEERLGQRSLVTRFDRDAKSRIASVADAVGNASTWRFDGLGRMVEVDHPDAGVTSFDFDDAGNLRHRTDARGAYVATDYDPLGRPILERLIASDGAEEEKVAYHYDDPSPLFQGDVAIGELSWVEDGAGEEHFRRDERGRLVESVRKVDGKSYRIERAYDDLDRLTRLTYPDGHALDRRYNPRGLLESVPGVITSISYDARGKFTRREHANGSVTSAAYDDLERLSTLETKTRGATAQSLGYRYDRAGNLQAIDDALRKTGPLAAGREYGYDDLYRLVSAVGGDRSWTYAFDDVGDFTKKSDLGDYTIGKAHQIVSAGGKTYRYDEAGNIVERPNSKQAFDAKGRIKSLTLADGTVVAYRYDHTGRRVVKESQGPKGAHRTVYVGEASEERDGESIDYVMAGQTRLARIGGGRPTSVATAVLSHAPPSLSAVAFCLFFLAMVFGLARSRERARSVAVLASVSSFLAFVISGCSCSNDPAAPIPGTHYHGDHLAGTAFLTSPDGSVAAEIAYDPWGSRIVGATEPYSFTGKEYEADTGLYDFGARLYDAVLGVFLSPDPVALTNPERLLADPQLLNPYSYTRNSPATYVDPDGREPLPAAVAGGLAPEQPGRRAGSDGVTRNYICVSLSGSCGSSPSAAMPSGGSFGPAGAAGAGALGAAGRQAPIGSSQGSRAGAFAVGGAVAAGLATALAPRTAGPALSGAATGAGMGMLTGKGAAVAIGGALLGAGIATGLKAAGFAVAGPIGGAILGAASGMLVTGITQYVMTGRFDRRAILLAGLAGGVSGALGGTLDLATAASAGQLLAAKALLAASTGAAGATFGYAVSQ